MMTHHSVPSDFSVFEDAAVSTQFSGAPTVEVVLELRKNVFGAIFDA